MPLESFTNLPVPPLRATEDAPRPVHEALALTRERHGVADRAHHAAQTEAAAMLARAAGILDEAVALDQQRILHLDRLDRQVGRVGDVHLHAVLAVLGEAPAEAAAERFEIDVVAVVARIVAEEHGGRVGAVRGADRGLGDCRRERADHDIDDALRGVRPRRDGGREFRVDQCAERGVDVDQVDQALVVRHVRIEQGLERIEHAGERADGASS